MAQFSPNSSTTQVITIPKPSLSKKLSSSSVRSLQTVGSASSTSSILFGEEEVDPVVEDGLRHAGVKLEARRYKSPSFAASLLEILQTLQVPSWSHLAILPRGLVTQKVSGSLTNAVFFVSYPSIPNIPTLLLRIYGPSSGSLISRPRELHTLHILSSQYRIGPRVYGTFENGRVEEYFDSTTLTASDIRDAKISRWIGARMAELHSVDVDIIEETSSMDGSEGRTRGIGARKNVESWLHPAQAVLNLPTVPDAIRKELDLDCFKHEWSKYMQWLSEVDDLEGGSRRVFSHNDTQYGNLLRLTKEADCMPEHHQIIVVDFEYASPNPASFDIANHFHEWTANYHSTTPHILSPVLYPTLEERYNFYDAYLTQAYLAPSGSTRAKQLEMKKLDAQVRAWSPASHAMWAIWGIVQAREDLEADVEQPEFDYIGYACCRMAGFRREIRALGM